MTGFSTSDWRFAIATRRSARAECLAKLCTVEEEADESEFWLGIVMVPTWSKQNGVTLLHREAVALTAIMDASRMTARRNAQSKTGYR